MDMGLDRKCAPNAAEHLARYGQMLIEKNQVMNLTAITDPDQVAQLHMLDCASLLQCCDFQGKRLLDVGTGAGFPGIPLSIMCPDVKVILLDSLQKRLTFLDSVIEALDLNAVTVHSRAEDGAHKPHLREGFDMCTARAVAATNVLSEYLLPYARVGGKMLCYKGPTLEEELTDAKRAIGILGGRIESTHAIEIPGRDWDHRICVVRKIKKTPPAYPRKAGAPSKKPL